MSEIKIYDKFEENLLTQWQKLYELQKADYNLCPQWCIMWYKHFGNNNRRLFIYTVWEDNELKALAPFYSAGKILNPIGTKPGFYDEFDILSCSNQYTKEIISDIISKQLKLDLRLVNPESNFIKFLFRGIENTKIFSKKIYFSSLKFRADKSFKFDKSFAHRIKRKITSSNNKFQQKLNFEFETEKNTDYFEEMLSMHKKRWSIYQNKENEQFIKDVYFNTDFLILSRLSYENTNESVSYQLAYKYFDRITIVASAYDPKYEIISPSLLIHFNFFNEGFEKGYSVLDFGIGAHSYKHNFANAESVIISMKTDSSFLRKYDFIYEPLKELKHRVKTILE